MSTTRARITSLCVSTFGNRHERKKRNINIYCSAMPNLSIISMQSRHLWHATREKITANPPLSQVFYRVQNFLSLIVDRTTVALPTSSLSLSFSRRVFLCRYNNNNNNNKGQQRGLASARVVPKFSRVPLVMQRRSEYDVLRGGGGGRMSRGDKLSRHTFPSSHAFP